MRVTGDSVGPRVGDILKARGVNCFVYGDSISNVNAHKLEMYQNLLSVCHAGDIVIAVDAALEEIRKQLDSLERSISSIESTISEISSQLENLKSGM